MAVLAILVAMGVPRFLGYQKDADVTAMQADCKVLEDACMICYTEDGTWPVGESSRTIIGVEAQSLNPDKLTDHYRSLSNELGDYYLVTAEGDNEGVVLYEPGCEGRDGVVRHSIGVIEKVLGLDFGDFIGNEHVERTVDIPMDCTLHFMFTYNVQTAGFTLFRKRDDVVIKHWDIEDGGIVEYVDGQWVGEVVSDFEEGDQAYIGIWQHESPRLPITGMVTVREGSSTGRLLCESVIELAATELADD